MKFTTRLCFLLIFSTPLAVLADSSKVYKKTDDKGVVEFSDKKSPGAEKIKVKPNVVDLTKPKIPESKKKDEKPVQDSVQTEEGIVTRIGTTRVGNPYNADGEAIKEAKEKHDKVKEKAPVTIQPVKKTGAKHGGGKSVGGR